MSSAEASCPPHPEVAIDTRTVRRRIAKGSLHVYYDAICKECGASLWWYIGERPSTGENNLGWYRRDKHDPTTARPEARESL